MKTYEAMRRYYIYVCYMSLSLKATLDLHKLQARDMYEFKISLGKSVPFYLLIYRFDLT